MGVRGLSSYVTGCQRACSEHVDLNESADGGPDATDDRKRPVRLAVDGLALVYHVMQNAGTHDLHLELGCDYQSLHDALLDYLSALTAGAGISVLVIVDGMQDGDKEGTTLERRRSQAADASSAMELLLPSVGGKGEGGGGSASAVAAAASLQHSCSSLLPLFAVETLGAACRDAGVLIRAAEREADPELAAACRRRPRAGDRQREQGEPREFDAAWEGMGGGGCDAVLSNDSDFLVMDIPGYIPFWSLGVGADGSAGALVFRRPLVAARLGIPADQMPELACLVGNDWIAPESHVHRLIMESAAAGGGSNSGPKKKRKGSCSQKPGAGATKSRRGSGGGSSSNSNSSNGSGSGISHTNGCAHPTASARDFVEATGRYLTEFLRQDGSSRTTPGPSGATGAVSWSCGDNGVDPDVNAVGDSAEGDDVSDGGSQAARRLCARFFPALSDRGEGGGSVDVGGGCDENTEGQRQQQQQQRQEEQQGTLLPGASEAGCSGGDSTKQRGKSKKGKGRKDKRHGGGTSSSSGGVSGCREQERAGGENGATVDEGGAAAFGDGRAGDGEEFLRKFLAARLHYEVPPPRDSDAAGEDEDQRPLTEGRKRAATTGAGSGLSLSSVGLRAGIWAPPELAQAVLEGVFWCRVMVEDSSAIQDARTTPPTDPTEPPHPTDTRSDLPTSYSSGFATFSSVRKGLYELCLAQLVDVKTGSGADSNSATPRERSRERFAVASARRRPSAKGTPLTAPAPAAEAAAVGLTAAAAPPPPLPPSATTEASKESGGGGGRSRGRVLPREGEEWVVREFRRVGASVKVVKVVCQVPPRLRLDSSSHMLERWGVCLSKLGLIRRENRLLDSLMSMESRPWLGGMGCRTPPGQPTDRKNEKAGSDSTGLTALALVGALLLSTAAPATANSAATSSREARIPAENTSRPIGGGSQKTSTTTPGTFPGGREQETGGGSAGEEDIVAAFLAAATGECCRRLARSPVGSASATTTTTTASGAGDENGRLSAVRSGKGSHRRKGGGATASAPPGDIASRTAQSGRSVASPSPDGQGCALYNALQEAEEGGEGGGGREKLAGQRRGRPGDDGRAGGGAGKREFVNRWSKVQSAVWHVNACLAAARLIPPAPAPMVESTETVLDDSSDGGGGGGGGDSRRKRGEDLAPVDPLSLRPTLALEFFQQGGICRRLRARLREQRQQPPRPTASKNRQRQQQHRRRDIERPFEGGYSGNERSSSRSSADGASLPRDQGGCCEGGCAWVDRFRALMGAAGLP